MMVERAIRILQKLHDTINQTTASGNVTPEVKSRRGEICRAITIAIQSLEQDTRQAEAARE